jgi:hypothetical protein
MKQIIWILLTISMLSGCDFIENSFEYKDTTQKLVENLIKKDYNKCLDYLNLDYKYLEKPNVDSLKVGMNNLSEYVIKNYGKDLNYSLLHYEKTYSTNNKDKYKLPNTTEIQVEFNNNSRIGVFTVLIDEKSKKVLHIDILDINEPIPNMTIFWLFGILAFCIPIFNMYVIRQIYRSNVKRKWLKYLAIVSLNAPSITYKAIGGLSIAWTNFQFLFGFSFLYSGYFGSAFTVGLPLGGLYWFWKLRQRNNEQLETEVTTDQNIESKSTSYNDKPSTE